MLERDAKQKLIIRAFVLATVLSVTMLSGLLIWRATKLSSIEAAVSEKFALGPFGLFEMVKIPIENGYQASIGFLPGVAGYFAIWILLTTVYVLIKLSAGGQTSRN